jgi:hypothetical protein
MTATPAPSSDSLDQLTPKLTKKFDEFAVRFPWWKVFLIFGLLWAAFFWPALHDAWWYADDFWLGEWTGAQRWGPFVFGQGRPILGLWSYSFFLDNSPNAQWANILLRWFQGGVHVLSATLLAALLWSVIRHWTAALAALPFLLWPFNADAVLIRSASLYAIAGLLSFLGLWLIRVNGSKRDRFYWISGTSLCGLSMLAEQSPAFAGIAVWIVLVGLTAIQSAPMPWRRLVREAVFLAIGTITGAAVSYWLIKANPISMPAFVGRGHLRFDVPMSLRMLAVIDWMIVLFPAYVPKMRMPVLSNWYENLVPQHATADFYPRWLQLFHVLLIASTLFAILLFAYRKFKTVKGMGRPILVFLCLVLSFVAPFSAQMLAVGQLAIVLRTLYLAPVLFTACAIFTLQLLKQDVWFERVTVVLLFAILVSYWPISRKHAAEYVSCYEADMADLRDVEQHAAELGLTRVLVVPGMVFWLYNPHHFKYSMLCTHNSSLAYPWVRETFIRNRSGLQPLCQPEDMPLLVHGDVDSNSAVLQRALDQKKRLVSTSKPQFQRIDGTDVMGVFLPGKSARLTLTAPEGSFSAAHATVSVNSLGPVSLGTEVANLDSLQMTVSGLKPLQTYRLWLATSRTAPYGPKQEISDFKTNSSGGQVLDTIWPLYDLLNSGRENTAGRGKQRFLLITPADSDTAELVQKSPDSIP